MTSHTLLSGSKTDRQLGITILRYTIVFQLDLDGTKIWSGTGTIHNRDLDLDLDTDLGRRWRGGEG